MTVPISPEEYKGFQDIIRGYVRMYSQARFAPKAFIRGVTRVPASGKVVGEPEIVNAMDAVLEAWFTEGHWTDEFERALAHFVGRRYASMCNSGSSANLLAVSAFVQEDALKRLRPGDGVVTAACGFPTTLNPILMNGLTPLFLDVELGTYVPSEASLAEMVEWQLRRSDRASGARNMMVFMAHTLGNPFPLAAIKQFSPERVVLIEDNCDALGSVYLDVPTGTLGDMATQSFYPAHQITTGEGGAVLTDSPKMRKIVESLRDWGRDCWCDPGKENTCGKRFEWDFEGLPAGYDHKYVYSRMGYNLKSTDVQAAIGAAQLTRLPEFTARRRANFDYLYERLKDLADEFLILPRPTMGARASWFGFPLTVHPPVDRNALVRSLWDRQIDTRNIFGGNLLRQPAYRSLASRPEFQRELPNADRIARDSFWVGVWPGLTDEMLDWIALSIRDAVSEQLRRATAVAR